MEDIKRKIENIELLINGRKKRLEILLSNNHSYLGTLIRRYKA